MPYTDFGESFGEKENVIFKLKGEGQKIQFRLVKAKFFYTAKHFIKDDNGWTVTDCERILNGGECMYCQKAQQYYQDKKRAIELHDTKNEKVADDLIRRYKPTINFFYPIIDRETGKARILQVSKSVRFKFEDEFKAGVDVFKYDWVLTRTERPGADYYKLSRVDSSDTKELSPEELKEYEKAQKWDLEQMVGGKQSQQSFEVTPDLEEFINGTGTQA